jgi:hypothetical protein
MIESHRRLSDEGLRERNKRGTTLPDVRGVLLPVAQ